MKRSAFTKATDYFYVDDDGKVYFSLEGFFRISNLPDDPRLRDVVIDDIQNIFPGILILEEWLDDDPETKS